MIKAFSVATDACCPSCDIFTDNFNRTSSTNLGSNWDERVGDWSIVSDTVLEVSSADALVRYTSDHPDTEAAHKIRFKFKGDTDGDLIRGVVAITDDAQYLFAEVELDTSGCGTLRLYKRESSSNTQLGADRSVDGVTLNTFHEMEVCYYGGLLSACVIPNGGSCTRYSESVTQSGLKVGLGTGSTLSGTATFDDFQYFRHSSSSNPTCPVCTSNLCTYFSDDFNRADSTNIGCVWEEVVGDWEITSVSPASNGRLAIGTADARAIAHVPAPSGSDEYVLRSQFTPGEDGDKVAVLFDWVDDQTYHWAQYETVATDDAELKIFKRTGGIDSTLLTVSSLESANLFSVCEFLICMESDRVLCNLVVDNGLLNAAYMVATTAHGGHITGVGTGDTVGATDIIFTEHKLFEMSSNKAGCFECYPCCGTSRAAIQYKVVISGIVDNSPSDCSDGVCTDYNGTYTLSYEQGTGRIDLQTDGDGCLAATGFSYCRYSAQFADICDNMANSEILLTVSSVGGEEGKIHVEIFGGGQFHAAFVLDSGLQDLANLVDLSLSPTTLSFGGFQATPAGCDWTSATCKVTAL